MLRRREPYDVLRIEQVEQVDEQLLLEDAVGIGDGEVDQGPALDDGGEAGSSGSMRTSSSGSVPAVSGHDTAWIGQTMSEMQSRGRLAHGLIGRAVIVVESVSDRADRNPVDPLATARFGLQGAFSYALPGGAPSAKPAQPMNTVVQEDAVSWLRSLDTGSVDLIVTDPAYESLEKHRARGTTTRLKHSKASSNDWFQIFPNTRFPEFFEEAYRVLAKDRHFYLFCDQETMFVAKPLAEAAGFRFWKPLVWDKQRIGMGYHYRSRYEFILFFEKGKRRLNDLGVADILQHPRVHRGYPAEKPVAVSSVLVRQSSERGEVVIDPFTGSGSVGVAAVELGRGFLGTDICEQAVTIANTRLAAAVEGVRSEAGSEAPR